MESCTFTATASVFRVDIAERAVGLEIVYIHVHVHVHVHVKWRVLLLLLLVL